MTEDGRCTLDARAGMVPGKALDSTCLTALSDQSTALDPHVDDWLTDGEPYGILETVVRQTTPVVRPDDVLSALPVVADVAPPAAAKATRLEQGRLDDGGGNADSLAQDRAAAGARRGEPAAG